MLNSKNADFPASARVLHRKQWPEDINSQLTFAENKLIKMLIKLQLNEGDRIRSFYECLLEKGFLEKLKHLKSAPSTVPI
jgi:hypothetical protein